MYMRNKHKLSDTILQPQVLIFREVIEKLTLISCLLIKRFHVYCSVKNTTLKFYCLDIDIALQIIKEILINLKLWK